MANVSTTLSSAKIQGLFKQPAHSLYLLKTCLGGSSLKSHVITLHVIQQSSLSFANCFYMLSMSLPVGTALSRGLNPWPTWSQSPLGAPRAKVLCWAHGAPWAAALGRTRQSPWCGGRAFGKLGQLEAQTAWKWREQMPAGFGLRAGAARAGGQAGEPHSDQSFGAFCRLLQIVLHARFCSKKKLVPWEDICISL